VYGLSHFENLIRCKKSFGVYPALGTQATQNRGEKKHNETKPKHITAKHQKKKIGDRILDLSQKMSQKTKRLCFQGKKCMYIPKI